MFLFSTLYICTVDTVHIYAALHRTYALEMQYKSILLHISSVLDQPSYAFHTSCTGANICVIAYWTLFLSAVFAFLHVFLCVLAHAQACMMARACACIPMFSLTLRNLFIHSDLLLSMSMSLNVVSQQIPCTRHEGKPYVSIDSTSPVYSLSPGSRERIPYLQRSVSTERVPCLSDPDRQDGCQVYQIRIERINSIFHSPTIATHKNYAKRRFLSLSWVSVCHLCPSASLHFLHEVFGSQKMTTRYQKKSKQKNISKAKQGGEDFGRENFSINASCILEMLKGLTLHSTWLSAFHTFPILLCFPPHVFQC